MALDMGDVMINEHETTEDRPRDDGWGVLGGLMVLAISVTIAGAVILAIPAAWDTVAAAIAGAWHGLAHLLGAL